MQLVPKASNLPAAWTTAEDARLLLAAQRMGYYPNSAARRQNASEGFVARFMLLYTPVRVSFALDITGCSCYQAVDDNVLQYFCSDRIKQKIMYKLTFCFNAAQLDPQHERLAEAAGDSAGVASAAAAQPLPAAAPAAPAKAAALAAAMEAATAKPAEAAPAAAAAVACEKADLPP